jgi:hypothetical protein
MAPPSTSASGAPVPGRTPDMMPLPGQKYAPPEFYGRHDKIIDFLAEFNQIANSYNLSDIQKCERVVRYCSKNVKELIESLEAYRTPDWTALQTELIKLYDAARSSTRYYRSDLEDFAHEWKYKKIKTMSMWKKYVRRFTRIAGWLLANNKITADEKKTFFWLGIHRKLKNIIENRLIPGANPPIDLRVPFAEDRIMKVVENSILERDRFDRGYSRNKSELEESDDDDSASDVSASDDSSDEESDREDRKRRSKKKVVRRKKSHRERDRWDSEEEQPKKSQKKSQVKSSKKESRHQEQKNNGDEMEDLIEQMGRMSISDPDYVQLYYRVLSLNPFLARCLKAPSSFTRQSRVSPSYSSINPPMPIANSIQNPPMINPRYNQSMSMGAPITCYGCGIVGHGISQCPKIEELIQTGVLVRGANRKISFKDGTPIFRVGNETIIQATERIKASKVKNTVSHFYAIKEMDDSDSDSDQDDCDVYLIPGIDYESDSGNVLAAERTTRQISKSRKEAFDGVYPPSKARFKGKENIKTGVKATPIPSSTPKPVPLSMQRRTQASVFYTSNGTHSI